MTRNKKPNGANGANGNGPHLEDIVQEQKVTNRLLHEMLGEIRTVGGRLENFIGTATAGHHDVLRRLDALEHRIEALEDLPARVAALERRR